MPSRPQIADETHWQPWREKWSIRDDTTYLNHGSFGPPPRAVQHTRAQWQRRLDANPMDFLVRQLKDELLGVRQTLSDFVGASPEGLILVDNATYAMNVVANSFPLGPQDEVLLTDHEYGAVRRIWQRQCGLAQANLRTVNLPERNESSDQIVETIAGALTDRTKLLVVSHITSPTAITLPVQDITRRAQANGVAVCIDGPHAVAQLPLAIDKLGCDFYAASCHKWLSASLGTGFLWVHPRWRKAINPPILSWGDTEGQDSIDELWDEFWWLGTRDASALLTIPTAIAFLKQVGLDTFRARTHYLARYARQRLTELTGLQSITPDDVAFYGAMAHVPLPPGESRSLQAALWGQYGIEVPIVDFAGRRWIRVSCHLYTQRDDIDRLIRGLQELLPRFS